MSNISLASNEINIRITKAVITRLWVDFIHSKDEGIETVTPEIKVDVALMTATNQKITEVQVATNAWNENLKLPKTDIDATVFYTLGEVVQKLLPALTRKLNAIDKLLTTEFIS